MSYEEDYRKPYSAKCACGKGYLQFYRIYLSNDWGQEKENDTAVEIFCDSCKEKYHYERNYGNDYLVYWIINNCYIKLKMLQLR